MTTGQEEVERDLDFSEAREIEEHQLTIWSARNLQELLDRKEYLVWNAAGENGGIAIRFDPELFLAALEHVTLPGLSAMAAGRSSTIEVAVFENALRMRSQSPYITFEAELPLNEPVSDLPEGGVAFLIKPHRFEPFFSYTSVKSQRGEPRPYTQRDPSRGFDMFEYLVDESVLVLSLKESRIGLEIEATIPSEALPKLDPKVATPLPSVKALEQALRCAAYVKSIAGSRARGPSAVIRDGRCTAVSGSRAAIFGSQELEGLDLTVPLNTPLKLATMLRRLRDPARMAINDGLVIIDDGHLRCAFPVAAPSLPVIPRDEHIVLSANSTWIARLDDLHHLWGVFSTIAREKGEVDLTITEKGGTVTLTTEMEETGSKAWKQMDLIAVRPAKASDAPAYKAARVIFRDLAKVLERLTEHRITIAINSSAVILTQTTESSRREYFVGRSDITSSES